MNTALFRVMAAPLLGLAALGLTLALLPGAPRAQALTISLPPDGQALRSSQWVVPTASLTDSLVLAHWMGWFGQSTHRRPVPPYQSADPAAIGRRLPPRGRWASTASLSTGTVRQPASG